MQECEQGHGVSVFQHGVDVAYRYADLARYIAGAKCNLQWPRLEQALPMLQALAEHAMQPADVSRYQIYHDCGKPFCRVVDEDGRAHFPDHANISAAVWQSLYPTDTTGHTLIKYDLHPHTAKGVELDEFCALELAPTLMLTAWAALYANAELLFGGVESDSFKMKFKRLLRLSKRILNR